MTGFPGAVYDENGASLNSSVPDLTQEQLDSYQHRSMVTRDGLAPVAQVWVLADDATYQDIPEEVRAEAVRMVLSGKGIVILSDRAEPGVDVRDALLDQAEAVDDGTPDNTAGHA